MRVTPGFDLWTTFFSFVSLLGFATSAWLFFQKEYHRPFRWLGSIVLLFAIMLAEWVLWWTGYIELIPFVKTISSPFPFFIGVLLLGYYRSAFDVKMPAPVFWHYLPGILFVVKIIPTYLLNMGWKVFDWGKFTFINQTFDAAIYLLLLHFTVYPILIYMAYRSRFEPDPDMLSWHHWILTAYFGIVAGFWLHEFLLLTGLINPRLDILIAFFITAFMLLVGWLGIAQRRILTGATFLEAILPKKYAKSALPAEVIGMLAERILVIFENEKIHLDPDLTLDSLANKVGESRHHVSLVVNSKFGMSYSDWVAQWRVKEAQTLLKNMNQNNLIIKEIAYQSGFNTKAAFNLAFKKWTGQTPTEFRAKSQGKNKEIGQK